MNWLIVVLFATGLGDMYIFTEPTFETRQECMLTLTDPYHIRNYTRKLASEYDEPMPIELINCIEEETLKRILNNASGGSI
tara:strand:+ start:3442 stop:3684 length:243 start_codon:yes stop_codon:yes gene_type:complete